MPDFRDDPENAKKAFGFRVIIESKLVKIDRTDIDPGRRDPELTDKGWNNSWKLVPVKAKVYWPRGWYGYAEDGHLGPEIVSEVPFHDSVVNGMVWLTGLPDHHYSTQFPARSYSFATCIDPKANVLHPSAKFPYLARIDVGVIQDGGELPPYCRRPCRVGLSKGVCGAARDERLKHGPATQGTWNPGCLLTKTWMYAPFDTGTGLKDWWKVNWSTLLAIGVVVGLIVLLATGTGAAIAGAIAKWLTTTGWLIATIKWGIVGATVAGAIKGTSNLIQRASDIVKAKAQEASEHIHAYWTCPADRNNAGCERYYDWKPPEDQQKFAEVIEFPSGEWCIPSKSGKPLCVKGVGRVKLSFPAVYALIKSIDKEFWALADGKPSVLFDYEPQDFLDAYYYLNHMEVISQAFSKVLDAIWNHGFEILPEFWGAWAAVGKSGTDIPRGEGIFDIVIKAMRTAIFGGLASTRPPAPPPTSTTAPDTPATSPITTAPKSEEIKPAKPGLSRAGMITLGALAAGGIAIALLRRKDLAKLRRKP